MEIKNNNYKCNICGEEMVFNVPRMGLAGGLVHKGGGFSCKRPVFLQASNEALQNEPEYRMVEVDGFDFHARQIIIKYDKHVPMPMVSVGDKMLVAWKPDREEES